MFSDFRISSLRLFALYAHFLVTCVLYWTRHDCVTVTLSYKATDSDYDVQEENFVAVLSVQIVVLLFRFLCHGCVGATVVRLDSCISLLLDCSATFFIVWMILDGWDWRVFIYIFLFCSLFPAVYDSIQMCLYLLRQQFVLSRRVPSLATSLYHYVCVRRTDE
jgi:hypothetical protein